MKDKIINNKSFVFEEIDCDKNSEFADKYKIEGYLEVRSF